MKKTYRLPKEFAEKWVAALRSGEYTQGENHLLTLDEVENTCHYCCLGVAGIIGGIDSYILEDKEILDRTMVTYFIPEELIGDPIKNDLVATLVIHNDGYGRLTKFFTEGRNKLFNYRTHNPTDFFALNKGIVFKLDFNQIADFIEDNVEFYT